MGIGSRLRELLALRGSNANQLAQVSGVNVNTIYSILRRNNTKVDLGDLKAICDALNVTLDYFASEPGDGKKAADVDDTAAALRSYFIHKIGREPTDDELARLDDFADIFIKGLNQE